MIVPTKKVWALVEVADFDAATGHGNREPVLIGGIDVEAAKHALLELCRLRLDVPIPELFKASSATYVAPRTLRTVIRDDYARDAQDFVELIAAERAQINRTRADLGSRVQEWQRDHPILKGSVCSRYGISDATEAFLKYRDAQQRESLNRLLDSSSLRVGRTGWTERCAKWLGTAEYELCARTQGDEDQPFFSEAYLYVLLGKDAARTLRAQLKQLARALGIDLDEISSDDLDSAQLRH